MKIVFVKRPAIDASSMSVMNALRLTAKNGKAVQLRRPVTASYSRLARESLVVHSMRRGKFVLAWCENGSKKKGGR